MFPAVAGRDPWPGRWRADAVWARASGGMTPTTACRHRESLRRGHHLSRSWFPRGAMDSARCHTRWRLAPDH